MTDFTLRRKEHSDLKIERTLELITPMVGGGAVARMVDAEQPVNGKTIRGQLRFWWRATRSGRYGPDGLMAMQLDEAWLFGKAATFDRAEQEQGLGPSRVQVEVEVLHKGRVEAYRKGVAPDYAAFPLPENTRQNTPAARLISDLRFRVVVRVPAARVKEGRLSRADIEADLTAALWAWVTFGGLGARTRRGFGALKATGDEPTPKQIGAQLGAHVLPGDGPRGVPRLSLRPQDTVLLDGYEKISDAWFEAIEIYRDYRQARRGKSPNPGRSYWPEPDEIRRLTGDASPDHKTPLSSVRKFPRAALGLPVIFQFRKDGHRRGEPSGTITLQGHTDRLASPLILRPGAGGLLIATVLRETPSDAHPLRHLQLKTERARPFDVQHQLTPDEARELKTLLPQNLQAVTHFAPDLPAAFLAHLKETLQ